MDQIPEATTYKVVGGWDGKSSQAAIVRIWKTKDKKLIDNIESSIDLLKDVRNSTSFEPFHQTHELP